MVPGKIGSDPLDSPVDNSSEGINKYRLYRATDYSPNSGRPLDANDVAQGGPYWPIWDTSPTDTLKANHYFGEYIDDVTQRSLATYPKGPAFISGEDIFSTYKDTDVSRYDSAVVLTAFAQGYPLGIQVEQTDYSWGAGQYANFMFIKYVIINRSQDTLQECWMAPALDMDIGTATNDHNKIAIDDMLEDSLNLAVQWSEAESKKYGYVGVDFLESPAVNQQGFIRKDRNVYADEEQLGLQTFRNWTIEIDPKTPQERYDFMSSLNRDGDKDPGDKRFLMATGPFNMLPGDTARVVVGIIFAYGSGTTPTGQWTDMQNLIALDQFAQTVYDNNFLTDPSSSVATGSASASSLTLDQNYPNPFGRGAGELTSSVKFSLSQSSHVSLSIVDAEGTEVHHTELGYLPLGEHTITLDASSLTPGVYFYEIRTANESARGKMVVE